MLKHSNPPKNNKQTIIDNKTIIKQQQPLKQSTLNYAQIRTLKTTSKQATKLLPGLQIRNKKSNKNKNNNNINSYLDNNNNESKLLLSAVDMIKKRQQDFQDIQSQTQKLGISFFFNSRNITPINPLLGSQQQQNNSLGLKKRMITHQTNKSRLNSINSQYPDLQSQDMTKDSHFLSNNIHLAPGFRLFDITFGQSQIVFQHVFHKPRKINPKLINIWKQSLLHEDKTQIFIPINPQQKIQIPYTHPKHISLNQLQKGFEQIFGIGKNRCLKPGEESLIIDGIKKYLQKCNDQPMKIARKDFDIIQDILTQVKLIQLENYPYCYKQIETHFKIMATRWKYQNQQTNKINKFIQAAIISGKNNFIDLSKSGKLAEFLLKNSNKDQLYQINK